jgi:hypothetical protein
VNSATGNTTAAAAVNWDEATQRAIRFSYTSLSDIFSADGDVQMRKFAVDNGVLERILERIASVSREGKRVWVENLQLQQQAEQEETQVAKTAVKGEEEGKQKLEKKKGVGYGSDSQSGSSAKWNVNEYIEGKKQRSEQLCRLIRLVSSFLDFAEE